jgi:GntR family transcriptional regulator
MFRLGARADRYPLYYQVRTRILERIEAGEFARGDMLPSDEDLSTTYGVSMITTKRAMAELAKEGIVVRRQGKGTFVRAPLLEDLSAALALAKPTMTHAGASHHKLLSVRETKAGPEIANMLKIAPDSKVTSIERLKIIGNEPSAYESSLIPSEICPGLAGRMTGNSLAHEVLQSQYQVRLVRARLTIEPTILKAREARLLETDSGAPAMLLTRITYTVGDRPVEIYREVVRGDRLKYTLEFPDTSQTVRRGAGSL